MLKGKFRFTVLPKPDLTHRFHKIKERQFLPGIYYVAFVRSKRTIDLENNGLFFPFEFKVFCASNLQGKVSLL